MREVIYVAWIVLGTAALSVAAFTCWKMIADPYWLIHFNQYRKESWLKSKLRMLMILSWLSILWLAGFQFVKACLGWIPASWSVDPGNPGLIGTSALVGLWLGLALGDAIGLALQARADRLEDELLENLRRIQDQYCDVPIEDRLSDLDRLAGWGAQYSPRPNSNERTWRYGSALRDATRLKGAGHHLVRKTANIIRAEVGYNAVHSDENGKTGERPT